MTGGERLRFHLLCGAGHVLRLFGFPGTAVLGNLTGRLIWRFLPSRRNLAVNNIMKHLGMSREQAEETAKASFCHTGRAFLEILLTGKFGMNSPRLRIASPELMQKLRECDRPLWRPQRISAPGNCSPPCPDSSMRRRDRAWWWCADTATKPCRLSSPPAARPPEPT